MSYTFTDKSGVFTIAVKEDFLKKCPDPQNYTGHELNEKFQLWTFLHNLNGPAVINRRWDTSIKEGPLPQKNKDGFHEEWWENGEKIPDERVAELKHSSDFNDRLENLTT